jgi:leader peptidase (prepilin peptidase)/N-methyltransferase
VWWVTKFDPLRSDLRGAEFLVLDAATWTTLLAILVYDLKHKIIPDRFSLIFALLSGTTLLLRLKWGLVAPEFVSVLGVSILPWMHLLAAPLIALPFAALWFFSGGRAMGLGDAKLAWGIGWFLGISGGISAVVFAFWCALFPSIVLLLLPNKRFTMKSEIPFAPFLVLGTLIVYAWGVDILKWALF